MGGGTAGSDVLHTESPGNLARGQDRTTKSCPFLFWLKTDVISEHYKRDRLAGDIRVLEYLSVRKI